MTYPTSSSNTLYNNWICPISVTCVPRLRRCRIRDLRCSPNDLLLFLQRTAPRHIDLKSVTFKHGSWQRIFEHIAGRQTGVESVVLRELTNTLPGEHVWLPQAPTHPDFSVEGGIGDNTLELRGDAVRRPIDYRGMPPTEYDYLRSRAYLRNHKRSCVADPCSTCPQHNL